MALPTVETSSTGRRPKRSANLPRMGQPMASPAEAKEFASAICVSPPPRLCTRTGMKG